MLDFLTLSGELPPNPLQNRPDPPVGGRPADPVGVRVMKNITLPLLVLLLLTVPQLLDAQQRGSGRGAFLPQQNPIEAFLQRADSLGLGLSDDQALRLEMLGKELDETNAPARKALAELLPELAGGPDPDLFQQMQPHRQAMRDGNRAALQTAREEVLTEEQWTAVSSFLESTQPQGRRGRRGGGGPRPG